jgi:hypothetical protein
MIQHLLEKYLILTETVTSMRWISTTLQAHRKLAELDDNDWHSLFQDSLIKPMREFIGPSPDEKLLYPPPWRNHRNVQCKDLILNLPRIFRNL